MIGWIIVVAVTALLSYLTDVEVLSLLDQSVPFFGGSTISVILMIVCVMMLLRAMKMSKKGEKEKLRARVEELEQELENVGQTSSRDTELSTEAEEEKA